MSNTRVELGPVNYVRRGQDERCVHTRSRRMTGIGGADQPTGCAIGLFNIQARLDECSCWFGTFQAFSKHAATPNSLPIQTSRRSQQYPSSHHPFYAICQSTSPPPTTHPQSSPHPSLSRAHPPPPPSNTSLPFLCPTPRKPTCWWRSQPLATRPA